MSGSVIILDDCDSVTMLTCFVHDNVHCHVLKSNVVLYFYFSVVFLELICIITKSLVFIQIRKSQTRKSA